MNGWMEGDAWTAPGGDYDKVNIVKHESDPSCVMVSPPWPTLPPTAQKVKQMHTSVRNN